MNGSSFVLVEEACGIASHPRIETERNEGGRERMMGKDQCPGNIQRGEGSLTKGNGRLQGSGRMRGAEYAGVMYIYRRNGSRHCDSRDWYQCKQMSNVQGC